MNPVLSIFRALSRSTPMPDQGGAAPAAGHALQLCGWLLSSLRASRTISPDTVALVLAMACTMLPAMPCTTDFKPGTTEFARAAHGSRHTLGSHRVRIRIRLKVRHLARMVVVPVK